MQTGQNGNQKDKNKVMKDLAPYMNLGLQLALTVVLGSLLGWWIDGMLKTKPVFILIGSVFGVAAGMYSFLKTVSLLDKKNKKDNNKFPKD